MAAVPYAKPHLSVADQLELLKQRGLAVSDDATATAILQRLGYYRLSGYWFPMRESVIRATPDGIGVEVQERFKAGAELRHAAALYVFDKKLRLLVTDAIERIEVGLRVDIAHMLGARDPWAHLNATELHGNFAVKTDRSTGITQHQSWLTRLAEIENRSKEDYVKHFRAKYNSPLPIWISIELWDFGTLSMFIEGLKVSDKEKLAQRYGIPVTRWDLIPSWARSLNHMRNICAHHSRLWNRSPADQPKVPKVGEVALLDHLQVHPFGTSRIYAPIAIIQFLLQTLNPHSAWGARVVGLAGSFPTAPGLEFKSAGFPNGWDALPLWQQAGLPTAAHADPNGEPASSEPDIHPEGVMPPDGPGAPPTSLQ